MSVTYYPNPAWEARKAGRPVLSRDQRFRLTQCVHLGDLLERCGTCTSGEKHTYRCNLSATDDAVAVHLDGDKTVPANDCGDCPGRTLRKP